MVVRMLPALRIVGHHLVATMTWPGLLPDATSARASASSERPRPYASAVSNQLIPPSRDALTMAFTVASGTALQKLPINPCPPENCQHPRPIAEISISVRPRGRRGGEGGD